jgi:hypothetical protein
LNIRKHTPDTINQATSAFSLARTRIFLEGDFTKKFYYHFRLNIDEEGEFSLIVAFLQYNINSKMNLRMGRQWMALGREDWILAQQLASMEYSANDFTYAIGSSFGFQFHHSPIDKIRYWVALGNGAYGGKQVFPAKTPEQIGFTGRGELNLKGGGWNVWDNMTSHKGNDLQSLFGCGFGFFFGLDKEAIDSVSPQREFQFNVDYSLAGNGFMFFIQVSHTEGSFKSNSKNVLGFGVYSTLGYWVDKHWFVYGRFDFVPKEGHSTSTENYASPGIGVSYYPFAWSSRYQLTFEYNYLHSTLNNTPVEPSGSLGLIESSWGGQQNLRIQIQFGF